MQFSEDLGAEQPPRQANCWLSMGWPINSIICGMASRDLRAWGATRLGANRKLLSLASIKVRSRVVVVMIYNPSTLSTSGIAMVRSSSADMPITHLGDDSHSTIAWRG
ncbi:hypothetical protein EJ05DRAFT_477155 [Pseudovirgaria hyperparasitica]|uniref:Uncharacterized protein n=1 Tax=Pseudovirgaria hyperparasitica TaxID=470096 RepID=A0A6A6W208_9PEZI|nr:uncharacterized protein EJ05DRAFT_477155 [Pseudovirgaria hyperparasitica]KAF2756922.1 hypothetical protein EJ05DRAFT_477155 [Pseudovirgaria hyperparasitica]